MSKNLDVARNSLLLIENCFLDLQSISKEYGSVGNLCIRLDFRLREGDGVDGGAPGVTTASSSWFTEQRVKECFRKVQQRHPILRERLEKVMNEGG